MTNKKELEEQQAVMEWARWSTGKYPELELLFHIANEGKRTVRNGSELKKAGLSSGVPDLCLPCAKGNYHSLFIEMKKDRKCKPTPNQLKWIAQLNAAGNMAVVCYSADEAILTLKRYLSLKKY